MSSFLIKTCLKLNKCFRLTTMWYTWNYPSWGGSRPGPHPGTEIPNMALEWFRQMQFNSMMKTEFPVKIWARSSPFKGCFELNFQFMVPSLHALPIHVFWAWYVFLNEYTTYFSLSGTHTRPNMVYSLSSALLVKIWANLKAPPEGEIQACWGPYTTPVTTAILDVILKPMQSDLVGYRLFSGQISGL